MATIAKSIGTKLTYTTGTLAVDGTGLILTLSTGSFATDWGEGDKVIIDTGGTPETRYVLTRDSATQLTLQTASTKTGQSGLAYSIARSYSSMSGWQSGEVTLYGDLVTNTTIAKGVMYNDGIYNERFFMGGWTANGSYYPILTAATIARHNGKRYDSAGIRVERNAEEYSKTISQGQSYGIIEYVQVRIIRNAMWAFSGGTASGTIRNCIAYCEVHRDGFQYGFIFYNESGDISFCYNNIAYGAYMDVGFRMDNGPYMYNCTAYGCGVGVQKGDAAATYRNIISVGNGTDFDGSFGTEADYCVATGTAPGTHSLSGKTAANQFVSTTAGSEDFNLKAGADAIGAGIGPSSDGNVPTTDIVGTARSGATTDMGAFKYIAVSTGARLSGDSVLVGDSLLVGTSALVN